jgi:primosomal protein N' (replication factor Y)
MSIKRKIINYRLLVINNTKMDFFDYVSFENFQIGEVVKVSFGKEITYGLISEIENKNTYEGEKKFIISTTNIVLNKNLLVFIKNFSEYYICPQSYVLKNILNYMPAKYKYEKKSQNFIKSNLILTEEQKEIYESIKKDYNTNKISVIFGITGSGKSQIYFKLIENILNENGQILLLVPEVAIISGLKEKLTNFLNIEPEIWFAGKKNVNTWKKVFNGDNVVVIGARSSVFLPFKNLKMIIIDEEHDTSYKQSNYVSYHAVSVSIVLSKIWNIPTILGSATPSTETFYHMETNKNYKVYRLNKRFGEGKLPEIQFAEEEKNVIHPTCLKEIENSLKKNKQVLIYLNKRGFSRILKCINCKEKQKCKDCNKNLILHNIKNGMFCHLCNKKYNMNVCVYCNHMGLLVYGFGVERLEGYVKNKFPNANIGVFSSDFCNSPIKIQNFVKNVQDNIYNIIIGTQIISKGHNFPNLSLVVILNTQLQGGDFRGKEILLQNLLQVSGRTGRYENDGKVIIQSADKSIKNLLLEKNYENFLQISLKERETYKLPPFFLLVNLKQDNTKLNKLQLLMEEVYNKLLLIDNNNQYIEIFPPSKNPIEKISDKYRMFIMIKCSYGTSLTFLNEIIKKYNLIIDIDPYDFY